jgi:hypothetical protein
LVQNLAKSYYLGLAASGAASETVVESTGATESASASQAVSAGVAESAAATESASTSQTVSASTVESASATESASASRVVLAGVVESPGGALGLSAQQAAWLESIARLHGLIDPLVINEVMHTDGVIAQSKSSAGGVITVTTVAAPTGLPGASGLTPQQSAWLEALARAYGLVAPLQLSATGRNDGVFAQTFVEVGNTTTITRTA